MWAWIRIRIIEDHLDPIPDDAQYGTDLLKARIRIIKSPLIKELEAIRNKP